MGSNATSTAAALIGGSALEVGGLVAALAALVAAVLLTTRLRRGGRAPDPRVALATAGATTR